MPGLWGLGFLIYRREVVIIGSGEGFGEIVCGKQVISAQP